MHRSPVTPWPGIILLGVGLCQAMTAGSGLGGAPCGGPLRAHLRAVSWRLGLDGPTSASQAGSDLLPCVPSRGHPPSSH